MKKIMVLCLVASYLIFGQGVFCTNVAFAIEKPLDRIVAVVNDDVITNREWQRAVFEFNQQRIEAHLPKPPERLFKRKVLEQLIDQMVQVQLADQLGLQVHVDEVNAVVRKLANQSHLSVLSFYRQLRQTGIRISRYRALLHRQLLLQKLQQQEVISHIVLSPEEFAAFKHSYLVQNNQNKAYHLNDMLIPINDFHNSQELARVTQQANDMVRALSHDGRMLSTVTTTTFGTPITQHDLGWRKLVDVPSVFMDTVTHMKIHQVAGPIYAPNGLHIIQLLAMRSEGSPEISDQRIQEIFFQRKAEEAVQRWISKLRGQAFIQLFL